MKGVNGHPLVDSVEHSGEIQPGRQAQGNEPVAGDAQVAEGLVVCARGQAVGQDGGTGVLGLQVLAQQTPPQHTVDIHDEATEGVFSIPFKNLSALPLLAKEVEKNVGTA